MPTFKIAITVVNPGYEGTDAALGLLSLDFEDEKTSLRQERSRAEN